MNRFLLSLCAAALLAGTAAGRANVVFILADDLGWADLGCYGNAFHETPRIDGLARQGVRFTDFYAACPVCSPTRASILSGQYQARFGLTAHIPGHWRPFARLAEPPNALQMPREVITCAEVLEKAGYVTAHLGKWHLGDKGYLPGDQGFDEWVVTNGRHDPGRFRTTPATEVPAGRRLAEFLTDRAVAFLEKNRDRPFFLYLCHHAVHIPLDPSPELQRKYAAKEKVSGYPCNPAYAGLVEELDTSVGRVLDALDKFGLADDTLVVFTSDNGGLSKPYDGRGDPATSNRPLRGEKGTLYEGGVRVPLIVRWPGKARAGAVCGEPAISVDFYPTVLTTAGAGPPEGYTLDGKSLVPLLRDPASSGGSRALYWHYPHYHHSSPAGAVRAGRWKAIEFFETGKVELYDLQKDIGEAEDLAEKMPDRAEELRGLMRAWRRAVEAQMPQDNPAYDPDRLDEWWNRRTMAPITRPGGPGRRSP